MDSSACEGFGFGGVGVLAFGVSMGSVVEFDGVENDERGWVTDKKVDMLL